MTSIATTGAAFVAAIEEASNLEMTFERQEEICEQVTEFIRQVHRVNDSLWRECYSRVREESRAYFARVAEKQPERKQKGENYVDEAREPDAVISAPKETKS